MLEGTARSLPMAGFSGLWKMGLSYVWKKLLQKLKEEHLLCEENT